MAFSHHSLTDQPRNCDPSPTVTHTTVHMPSQSYFLLHSTSNGPHTLFPYHVESVSFSLLLEWELHWGSWVFLTNVSPAPRTVPSIPQANSWMNEGTNKWWYEWGTFILFLIIFNYKQCWGKYPYIHVLMWWLFYFYTVRKLSRMENFPEKHEYPSLATCFSISLSSNGSF